MRNITKKLILAVTSFCMVTAFSTGGTDSLAEAKGNSDQSKGTILFVPHDDRPTSRENSAEALEMLGYKVLMPPKEMLGGMEPAKDVDAIWKWTNSHVKGADAAVISTDTLLYGGLVASRNHDISLEVLDDRLKSIEKLRENNKNLKLYAFGSLMRTPDGPGGEEPDYYTEYGPKIFRRSGLLDKQDTQILNPNDAFELKRLEREIPAEYWKDWTDRRAKNLDITKRIIDDTRKGTFDYFVIGKDDNAPLSATHMESRHIANYSKDISKSKFQILAGIDEFAMLLLTRAVNDHEKLTPKVYVKYNDGKGADTVPKFSDETIGHSISSEIYIAGAEEVHEPSLADYVMVVHTDMRGLTGDGPSVPGMVNGERRPGVVTAVNHVAKMVKDGYKVGVADISFANGADNAFINELKSHGLMYRIKAYSGWNTATNSSGFALGQGLIACRLKDDDVDKLLTRRYLDDWCYQSNVRDDVMNNIYNMRAEGLVMYMGKYEKGISERATDLMRSFAVNNMPPIEGINKMTLTFPWHRTFIGGINLPWDNKK